MSGAIETRETNVVQQPTSEHQQLISLAQDLYHLAGSILSRYGMLPEGVTPKDIEQDILLW